jgi:hypothetical protein
MIKISLEFPLRTPLSDVSASWSRLPMGPPRGLTWAACLRHRWQLFADSASKWEAVVSFMLKGLTSIFVLLKAGAPFARIVASEEPLSARTMN